MPSSPPSGSGAAATWTSVSIDATSHTTRSFYDGHGHRFSLWCEGWHGRSGSERRAVQVVGSNPGQSPQLGDGTCRCQSAAGWLGRRRLATSRNSKSDRTCQHSRSYLGPAIKRWTLREVSMYGATPSQPSLPPESRGSARCRHRLHSASGPESDSRVQAGTTPRSSQRLPAGS